SIVIWTTTPWTLPANVAIAANPDIDYCILEYKNEKEETEKIVCSRNSINRIFGGQKSKVKKETKTKKYKDDVFGVNARTEYIKIENPENSEESKAYEGNKDEYEGYEEY
ncbi:MAG: hypothetical protein COY41_04880, partial [Candidatus Altarchaeum sp. CG_4_10_14_0_8_um_filter_32_851]